jgi:hypothetical protein
LKRNLFLGLTVASLVWLLSSWGYIGHYTITEQAGDLLKNKIKGINRWIPFITDHSSDPDFRKFWFKTESPKHFIDLDQYSGISRKGYILLDYDSLVKRYGEAFVIQQGTLPWATIAAFDSLRNSFKQKDWNAACLWASDLSHYVGDGFMPLHATSNYDGQNSGNKGIHLRYESKMVLAYGYELNSKPKSPAYIKEVPKYISNYILSSSLLCDSIFHADNKAKNLTNNVDTIAYLETLWKNTGDMTINQFSKASTALASLIYTAWKDAGSPDLKNIQDPKPNQYNCAIISAIQNPQGTNLSVNFRIFKKGTYKIDLRNNDGGSLIKGGKWEKEPGDYSVDIDISTIPKGIYLIDLDCANFVSVIKFIKK